MLDISKLEMEQRKKQNNIFLKFLFDFTAFSLSLFLFLILFLDMRFNSITFAFTNEISMFRFHILFKFGSVYWMLNS